MIFMKMLLVFTQRNKPNILDTDFVFEEFTTGLSFPTTMAFIDNDILVLQKNDGQVRHVLADGTILPNPVLDIEVSNLFGKRFVRNINKKFIRLLILH